MRAAIAPFPYRSPAKTGQASLDRSWINGNLAALGLGRYQPARKFFLELARQIDTEICAGIDAQRMARRPIEKQLHTTLTRTTGENLAHFAQFVFCRRWRKLQKHSRLFDWSCRFFMRAAVRVLRRQHVHFLRHNTK